MGFKKSINYGLVVLFILSIIFGHSSQAMAFTINDKYEKDIKQVFTTKKDQYLAACRIEYAKQKKNTRFLKLSKDTENSLKKQAEQEVIASHSRLGETRYEVVPGGSDPTLKTAVLNIYSTISNGVFAISVINNGVSAVTPAGIVGKAVSISLKKSNKDWDNIVLTASRETGFPLNGNDKNALIAKMLTLKNLVLSGTPIQGNYTFYNYFVDSYYPTQEAANAGPNTRLTRYQMINRYLEKSDNDTKYTDKDARYIARLCGVQNIWNEKAVRQAVFNLISDYAYKTDAYYVANPPR